MMLTHTSEIGGVTDDSRVSDRAFRELFVFVLRARRLRAHDFFSDGAMV